MAQGRYRAPGASISTSRPTLPHILNLPYERDLGCNLSRVDGLSNGFGEHLSWLIAPGGWKSYLKKERNKKKAKFLIIWSV